MTPVVADLFYWPGARTDRDGAVGETSFGQELRRLSDADPGRPAVTVRDETLTRTELGDRIDRLAGLFAQLGVRAGTTVTIGLPNSIEFVESMFAAWVLGAVPQPISPRLPSAEHTAIVELADPSLVVGVGADDTGGQPTLEVVPKSVPRSDQPIERAVAPVWKIVTSGGSTGRPKLIMAVQPALVENVVGFASCFDCRRTVVSSSQGRCRTTLRSSWRPSDCSEAITWWSCPGSTRARRSTFWNGTAWSGSTWYPP